MSRKYTTYIHHNSARPVRVRRDLKGKHRDYCLCYGCSRFYPDNREANCRIANMLFALCQLTDLTTPVWECPEFQIARDEEGGE